MTKYVPCLCLEVLGQGAWAQEVGTFFPGLETRLALWLTGQTSKTLDYYSLLARQQQQRQPKIMQTPLLLHYFWLPLLPSSEQQ